ncbi:MAG: hypothetical protein SVN78_09165 [Deferribacterota bacterium]|nr:hypothetical protein [Deferribacterota bacterium]
MKKLLITLAILLGVNFSLGAWNYYDYSYKPYNYNAPYYNTYKYKPKYYSNNPTDRSILRKELYWKLDNMIENKIRRYHMLDLDDLWDNDCDCDCY